MEITLLAQSGLHKRYCVDIFQMTVYLDGICFFGFLLKTICFQNLGCLFLYFFMTYYKLFTK